MASTRNTVIRSLHDLGGAAWFGGSLMGAVGLNGVSRDVADPAERTGIAAAGWARWSPVAAMAIAAHLIGGTGLLLANRGRVQRQTGAAANAVTKTVLTAAAIGTTAYSGVLGAKIARNSDSAPAEGGTVPAPGTPEDVARWQQQQRVLQWVTPAITGTILVMGAQQGEQQRPMEQLRNRTRKVLGQTAG